MKTVAHEDVPMSQARVDKDIPPTRQEIAIEAFARGIQVGFKRGLQAAQKGRQSLPALMGGMASARPLMPEEATVLSFLRDRR